MKRFYTLKTIKCSAFIYLFFWVNKFAQAFCLISTGIITNYEGFTLNENSLKMTDEVLLTTTHFIVLHYFYNLANLGFKHFIPELAEDGMMQFQPVELSLLPSKSFWNPKIKSTQSEMTSLIKQIKDFFLLNQTSYLILFNLGLVFNSWFQVVVFLQEFTKNT